MSSFNIPKGIKITLDTLAEEITLVALYTNVDDKAIIFNKETNRLRIYDHSIRVFKDLTDGNKLTEEIVSTIQLGGVFPGDTFAIGSSIQDAFKKLVAVYINPVFTLLDVEKEDNNPIIGQDVTIEFIELDFDLDSEGNPPNLVEITGPGFTGDDTITTVYIPPNVKIYDFFPDYNAVRNVATTIQWNLYGLNKVGDNITSLVNSLTWYNQVFFGFTNQLMDNSNFQSILISAFIKIKKNSKVYNVTAGSGNDNSDNYSFFGYPAAYGDLNNMEVDGTLNLISSLNKVGDFNYLNSYGVTTLTRVYYTNVTQAFSVNSQISLT